MIVNIDSQNDFLPISTTTNSFISTQKIPEEATKQKNYQKLE